MKGSNEEKRILYALYIFLFTVLVCLFLILSSLKPKNNVIKYYCKNNYCVDYDSRIISKNLTGSSIETTAKKLMIVAHPDDETLWGSHELYKEKYLVVCVTCGTSKSRVKEFSDVMSLSNDDYIMLGYPDLVKGKKSDWSKDWDDINYDIERIVSAKDWDLVVTHNPLGEYGHIHHKMTNEIVTEYADHSKLSYFGKFYWGKIPEKEKKYVLSADEYNFKNNVLIPVYKTQVGAINNLRNMVHYESWITYDEWYGEDE